MSNQSPLAQVILDDLAARGKAARPTTRDLRPYDEFHAGGTAQTEALAQAAGIWTGQHVLDVGCGIGGPSRFLAERYGARVTGVDLDPASCAAAHALTHAVGIRKVDFLAADANSLPFRSGRFDVLWSQHVAMSIADKPRLYAEWRRVLRPGGRLALFDVVAGTEGAPRYPTPWAEGMSGSFLLPLDVLLVELAAVGFRMRIARDVSGDVRLPKPVRDAPPPGLRFVLGRGYRSKLANFRHNLESGRIRLARIVAEALA